MNPEILNSLPQKITHLIVSSKLSDKSMQSFSRLSELRSLSLDIGMSKGDGLSFLNSLNTLRLKIGSNFDEKNLSNISSKTGLIDLTICPPPFSDYGLTDDGLSHLIALTELERLDLSGNSLITGEGLASLIPLKKLNHLLLMSCPVTNDGLFQLSKITSLTKLCLMNNRNITNEGLSHLTSLTNLTYIDLRYCSNITETDIEEFRKHFDNIEIIR